MIRIAAIILAGLLWGGCATGEIKPILPVVYGDVFLSNTLAHTKSMEPLLKGGERYLLSRIPYDEMKPGYVCVYKAKMGHKKYRIIHMVYRKWGDNWEMYGINNKSIDTGKFMTRENYIGTVVSFEPFNSFYQ